MAKTNAPPFPLVDVAVTLLVRKSRLLAVYNANWGAFTLPMSKRRVWDDPNVPQDYREEAWGDAAARAAAEWLGRTLTGPGPTLLLDNLPDYGQSDRDSAWKRYNFQVFQLSLTDGDQIRDGAVVEWLTADELLDENRRPISPTARFLVQQAKAQTELAGRNFP